MHTFDVRIWGCDLLVMFNAHQVVVQPDSCDGVVATPDITLYDLQKQVYGQIYRMQNAQRIYMETRVIECATCGKDKNWDIDMCSCPGCASFSERRPCQNLCHCAE